MCTELYAFYEPCTFCTFKMCLAYITCVFDVSYVCVRFAKRTNARSKRSMERGCYIQMTRHYKCLLFQILVFRKSPVFENVWILENVYAMLKRVKTVKSGICIALSKLMIIKYKALYRHCLEYIFPRPDF